MVEPTLLKTRRKSNWIPFSPKDPGENLKTDVKPPSCLGFAYLGCWEIQ